MKSRAIYFRFLAVLLMLCAATLVFANGSKEKGASGGQTAITFGNQWIPLPTGQPDYHLALVKQFEKLHPNIKVELRTYGNTYLTVTEKTWLASNTWPDGFLINTVDLATAAKGGQLLDWTPVYQADPKWTDSFLPGLRNEDLVNGKYWGVPNHFITNETMYYNSAILKKAGYTEFPKTWSGLLQLSAKLKSMGYIPMAMGAKDGWPIVSHLVEPLTQFICGPQWVKNIGAFTNKSSYADPCFVDVLTKINQLRTNGYLNSDVLSANSSSDDISYLFNQKAAILLSGSWRVQSVVTGAPKDLLPSIEVAPTPRPANAKADSPYGLFTGGAGWAFSGRPSLSKEKQAAVISLVKYLTGPEAASAALANYGLPPTKLGAGVDTSNLPRLQLAENKMISAAPVIPPMNQQQNGPKMANTLYKTTEAMLAGSIDPQQAAQQIEAEYKQVVANQ